MYRAQPPRMATALNCGPPYAITGGGRSSSSSRHDVATAEPGSPWPPMFRPRGGTLANPNLDMATAPDGPGGAVVVDDDDDASLP